MQHPNQTNMEDKFGMNFAHFDPESLFNPHMGGLHLGGVKRSAHEAGLDRESIGLSDEDESVKKEDSWPWDPNKDSKSGSKSKEGSKSHSARDPHPQTHLEDPARPPQSRAALPNGKKTKGRVKIKMEFIDNKLRRYTTFSKRKTGIMKKAYELSTLTGTQVMLLVASETGHVYTFATRKLQPMITSEAGKALIQTCLNSPDPPSASGGAVSGSHAAHSDQRMSATGYEETELTYAVADDEHKVRTMLYPPAAPSPFTPISSSSPSAPYHHHHHLNSSQPLPSPPSTTSSPTHHAAAAAAAAAAVSLALQSHHHPHHSQYHHAHSTPSPHLSPPLSGLHLPPHHSLQAGGGSVHSELTPLHQHSPHIPPPPQTPLPPQSPLPPVLSPMGTPSPTSPYPGLSHHPHHHISTHSR